MAILSTISNIVNGVVGRITAVKRDDDNLFFILDAFRKAIVLLSESLAVTDGSYPSIPPPGTGGGGGTTIINNGTVLLKCKAHMLTDSSVADNTSTSLDWDEIEYDTGSFHSITSNNTQFYAQTAGVYHIDATVEVSYPAGGTTGRISIVLYRIGAPSTIQAISGKTVIVGAFTYWLTLSSDIYLQAGESILLQAFNQGSGRTAIPSGTGTTGHQFPCLSVHGPI